jgi:hypothetical protein
MTLPCVGATIENPDTRIGFVLASMLSIVITHFEYYGYCAGTHKPSRTAVSGLVLFGPILVPLILLQQVLMKLVGGLKKAIHLCGRLIQILVCDYARGSNTLNEMKTP